MKSALFIVKVGDQKWANDIMVELGGPFAQNTFSAPYYTSGIKDPTHYICSWNMSGSLYNLFKGKIIKDKIEDKITLLNKKEEIEKEIDKKVDEELDKKIISEQAKNPLVDTSKIKVHTKVITKIQNDYRIDSYLKDLGFTDSEVKPKDPKEYPKEEEVKPK
jgi:hypothetical protein